MLTVYSNDGNVDSKQLSNISVSNNQFWTEMTETGRVNMNQMDLNGNETNPFVLSIELTDVQNEHCVPTQPWLSAQANPFLTLTDTAGYQSNFFRDHASTPHGIVPRTIDLSSALASSWSMSALL